MIGEVLRIRYEITQLISESPILQSYAATDKVQSREVCVRVVKDPYSGDSEFVERLGEVVQRLAPVRNPGIEELYEVDEDEKAVFLVGQLTRGSSLGERLQKLATFSVPAAVEILISVCDALQSLHRAGLSHGNVGSHSIWMQPDGEVRLQTAGLWHAYYGNTQAREAMALVGAPYMAPEISRGGLPTPASDVYSAGILLFELVTGRQPYQADGLVAMALQHATEPIPSARQMNGSVPQALDAMIRKAMEKNTSERYRDAGEFLSDLRMLQDALRFGKTLSWPIRQPAPAPAPEPKPDAPRRREPKPVVEKPPKPVRAQSDGDVIPFVKYAIVFFGGIFLVVAALLLYTNFQPTKRITVPDLAGLSMDAAKQALAKMGLKLEEREEQASERIPAGSIISTRPSAKEQVLENSSVEAVVSSGSRFVEVPDLRGVTVDKARDMLQKVGLQLDERTETVRDNNLEAGMIVSQIPPPRSKFDRETKVRVKVSSGKNRARSQDSQDANTKYLYTVHIKLSDIEQPVRVRVDMTDSQGTKTISDEQHSPGDEYDVNAMGFGSDVNFRIFYNGELVKQVSGQQSDSGTGDTGQSDTSTDQTDGGN